VVRRGHSTIAGNPGRLAGPLRRRLAVGRRRRLARVFLKILLPGELQAAVAGWGARIVASRIPSLDEIFVAHVGTPASAPEA